MTTLGSWNLHSVYAQGGSKSAKIGTRMIKETPGHKNMQGTAAYAPVEANHQNVPHVSSAEFSLFSLSIDSYQLPQQSFLVNYIYVKILSRKITSQPRWLRGNYELSDAKFNENALTSSGWRIHRATKRYQFVIHSPKLSSCNMLDPSLQKSRERDVTSSRPLLAEKLQFRATRKPSAVSYRSTSSAPSRIATTHFPVGSPLVELFFPLHPRRMPAEMILEPPVLCADEFRRLPLSKLSDGETPRSRRRCERVALQSYRSRSLALSRAYIASRDLLDASGSVWAKSARLAAEGELKWERSYCGIMDQWALRRRSGCNAILRQPL